MQTKALTGLEWKLGSAEGSFAATFATFNVVDKDGDVTIPGAFQQGQRVKIASWGHDWGALPVGDGAIQADGTRAWVDGQFYLDTTAGRDTYTTVKRLADLQEWSYGFEVSEWSVGEFDGQNVRFLRGLNVFEVSPVMVGAGVGTGTDAIKSSFADHAGRVLADLEAFLARSRDLSSLRAKEGRVLSEANRGRLRSLLTALEAAGVDIAELLAATEPKAPEKALDLDALYLDFLHTQARLSGALTRGGGTIAHAG